MARVTYFAAVLPVIRFPPFSLDERQVQELPDVDCVVVALLELIQLALRKLDVLVRIDNTSPTWLISWRRNGILRKYCATGH